MKTYVEGQEIAPGIIYVRNCEDNTLKHVISCNSSGSYVYSDMLDAIATLGDRIRSLESENAELKQQVPTEWRTGVPDISGVNPESWVEYVEDGDKKSYLMRARSVLQEESEWTNTVHRIIPYVSPPAPSPPKQLTVDDLPKVDGIEWSVETTWGDHESSRFDIYANIGLFRVAVAVGNISKQESVVEAALKAVEDGKLDQFLGKEATNGLKS